MRKSRKLTLSLVALLALPVARAMAWNAVGHSTIDLIAYRALPAEQRAKLDAILKQHPQYKDVLLAGCPEGANKEEYAFAKAGTWPDIVRDRNNPMNPTHHHGEWHYTDVPYFADGDDKTYDYKAVGPTKPGMPYDAVSAWKYNLARLDDPKVSPGERAVALCWVLHLGGDIHQPCHCVSLFSAAMPKGDKGANSFYFDTGHDRPQNVHAIWDGMLGEGYTFNFGTVSKHADEFAKAHDRASYGDQLKKTEIDDWVQEGRILAIKYVYEDGKFGAATSAHPEDGSPMPKMTEQYKKNGEEVAQKQAALAGYRTSDALSALKLPPSEPAAPAPEAK